MSAGTLDTTDATLQHVTARDGTRIAVHRLGPDGGAAVVLLPGTFSNASFWLGTRRVGFARLLAARGFLTFSIDPRGHGQSAQPGRHDRWTFDQWARCDLPAVIEHAATDGRHVLAIGHSAGGAVLLAALAVEPAVRARVAAAVVVATPLPWLQPWRRAGALAIHAASRLMRRFPARAVGLGPDDEPATVMRQWMAWNLRRQWIGDDGTDYVRALASVRTPVLALAGAGDVRWAPPAACEALFDHIGTPDRSFEVLGRETGYSRDFGHTDVLVGRAAQADVWPRIAAWLERQLR